MSLVHYHAPSSYTVCITDLMFQRRAWICSCCWDWAVAAGMPGTDLLSDEFAGSMLDTGRLATSG